MKIKIPALFLGLVIIAAVVPGAANAQLFKLKPSEAELQRYQNTKKAFTPAAARECDEALRKVMPKAIRKGEFTTAPLKVWSKAVNWSVPYDELAVIGAVYAQGPEMPWPGELFYAGCSMRLTKNKLVYSKFHISLARVSVRNKQVD